MEIKKQLLCICMVALILPVQNLQAQIATIAGPTGSGLFGKNITVLKNGNFVVCDPEFDEGSLQNVGAVYLYNGSTLALISTLKGAYANDNVGEKGIDTLANGNFVVRSPRWNNTIGAVTWVNATIGLNGVVSSSNSLVGSSTGDFVGSIYLKKLSNGNYLVRSPYWKNGTAASAGAVTWCNGASGKIGVVSSSNSFVGNNTGDNLGEIIQTLTNGNYVIVTSLWDNGTAIDAGAVTWCSGTTGRTGTISSSNSLIGSSSFDNIGSFGNIEGITALPNGNYVVSSYQWDNGTTTDVGAVTLGNGTTGISGIISSSNSIIGSNAGAKIGSDGLVVLSNGNYVFASPNANAITWCSGTTSKTGLLNNTNSLIGGTIGSIYNIKTLSNGNYVIVSPDWDPNYPGSQNFTNRYGAVTWCSGTTGKVGNVSSSNSLVGSLAGDYVGVGGVVELANGNFVILSPNWKNGTVAISSGASTWVNGTIGITGYISSANSLVGPSMGSGTSNFNCTPLTNGNYVVLSKSWDNGNLVDVGAATWCNGTTGRTGEVTAANSLIGASAYDQIGEGCIPLSNGNYVVYSREFDNGSIVNTGAVTWCNGTTGRIGVVSSGNSLVGTNINDQICSYGQITSFDNGNYMVSSPFWNQGRGALTWCNGTTGRIGGIDSTNSLVGSVNGDNIGYIGNSIIKLLNNKYLITSPRWSNGTNYAAGAITWFDANIGIAGVISKNNSLVGTHAADIIGEVIAQEVTQSGNYIAKNRNWDNGSGAVTLINGSTGLTGEVSSSNSLVGTKANDLYSVGVAKLDESTLVISPTSWDNGGIIDAGAILVVKESTGFSGTINSCNSLISTRTFQLNELYIAYDTVYHYTIVSSPQENLIRIFNTTNSTQTLAIHLDSAATNIGGSLSIPLVTNTGCKIIGSITTNGSNPLDSIVKAKVWIETTVPVVNSLPYVARHYEIAPTKNANSATAKLTLYFTQVEFNNFNAQPSSILKLPTNTNDAAGKANLKIVAYMGTSSNGSGLPTSYNGTRTIIDPLDADIIWNATFSRWEVSFNTTGFGGFIVQTNTSTLPLHLLDFNVMKQGKNVLLNWKTSNEQDVSHFMLERSVDGINFAAFGNTKAKNGSQENVYQYSDINARSYFSVTANGYYRLKMIDLNGNYTYSSIQQVAFSKEDFISLYPNPANSIVQVIVPTINSIDIDLKIIDLQGRIIKTWNFKKSTGNIMLDVQSLAPGNYQLEVLKAKLNKETIKLVKQ